MSCTNCNSAPKEYKDNCFEVGNKDCDPGCDSFVDTDCSFYNSKKSSLLYLPNIGIYNSVSLSFLLREIDKKFGQTAIADFSKFDLNGLDVGVEIKTLKQFSEALTKQVKSLKEELKVEDESIKELEELVEDLSQVVGDLVEINVSNSTLNINSTDDLRTVINKILSYVEDINLDNSVDFTDSRSINVTSSNNSFIAEVILNPDNNNIIKHTDEGIYATYKPTSETLNDIKINENLKKSFNSLVQFPCFVFDIFSSENNSNIKYIACDGKEINVIAQKDKLLHLTGVKQIITSPSKTLTITFKGI